MKKENYRKVDGRKRKKEMWVWKKKKKRKRQGKRIRK